ncbi:hypothetical protein ACSBR2_003262 [Camellia fascicularis]
MMSKKMSKKVCFSPELTNKPPSFYNHGSGTKVGGIQRKRVIRILSFRLQNDSSPGVSPMGFLRRMRAKFVRALRFVSITKRSSRKVSSSSSLTRSRSYAADAIDSHRAEAVEDCIEFLNSSSSCLLQRSNSVSASSSC